MLERIGHIKNPLTVIAMFAGIAEVSGTVVLPMLDSVVQETYVWFLMVFPCLLVFLFFATLWKNHKVLYAPSDYREEKNFMGHFVAQATNEESMLDARPEVSGAVAPSGASANEDGAGLSDGTQSTANQKVTSPPDREKETSDETVGQADSLDKEQQKVADDFSTDYLKSKIMAKGNFQRPGVKLDTRSILKSFVAIDLAGEFGGNYKINVSPKNLPNIKFDMVIESPDHYGVVQIVDSKLKLAEALIAMSGIKGFYETLTDSEKSRFFARIILIMHPTEKILEDERQQFASAVHQMPFKLEIEERYPAVNMRRMMEIN